MATIFTTGIVRAASAHLLLTALPLCCACRLPEHDPPTGLADIGSPHASSLVSSGPADEASTPAVPAISGLPASQSAASNAEPSPPDTVQIADAPLPRPQDQDLQNLGLRSLNASSQPSKSALVTSSSPSNGGSSLKLHISGVSPKAGPVRVAVFTAQDTFPKHETASLKSVVESTGSDVAVELENVPPPPIAIAVYQDTNSDGELNRAVFGIPTEPYGFSNNAGGQMGPPSFSAAQLPAEMVDAVSISLTKLTDER